MNMDQVYEYNSEKNAFRVLYNFENARFPAAMFQTE